MHKSPTVPTTMADKLEPELEEEGIPPGTVVTKSKWDFADALILLSESWAGMQKSTALGEMLCEFLGLVSEP